MRADETGHAIYLMECQAGGWNLPSKIYLILMSRTLLSLVQLLIEKWPLFYTGLETNLVDNDDFFKYKSDGWTGEKKTLHPWLQIEIMSRQWNQRAPTHQWVIWSWWRQRTGGWAPSATTTSHSLFRRRWEDLVFVIAFKLTRVIDIYWQYWVIYPKLYT